MTAPMMRSRQRGKPCGVQGHGSRCEVSDQRALRDRAQDKRDWQREAEHERWSSPGKCGPQDGVGYVRSAAAIRQEVGGWGA